MKSPKQTAIDDTLPVGMARAGFAPLARRPGRPASVRMKCARERPAVRGLICDRHHGHRDQHSARVQLPDGREVRIEWTVYDNSLPPAPPPLET